MGELVGEAKEPNGLERCGGVEHEEEEVGVEIAADHSVERDPEALAEKLPRFAAKEPGHDTVQTRKAEGLALRAIEVEADGKIQSGDSEGGNQDTFQSVSEEQKNSGKSELQQDADILEDRDSPDTAAQLEHQEDEDGRRLEHGIEEQVARQSADCEIALEPERKLWCCKKEQCIDEDRQQTALEKVAQDARHIARIPSTDGLGEERHEGRLLPERRNNPDHPGKRRYDCIEAKLLEPKQSRIQNRAQEPRSHHDQTTRLKSGDPADKRDPTQLSRALEEAFGHKRWISYMALGCVCRKD